MTVYENELDAYSRAYGSAMKNAKAWLEISTLALVNGHNGQAYSVAVTAYEEIGKAYVTWLAAKSDERSSCECA